MPVSHRQWQRGIKSTLLFYEAKLHFKNKTFNKIFPLAPYFKSMIGEKKEVFIADVGAGMFSTTGSTLDGVIIHLYPSDILADEFNALLQRHKIAPEIIVEKQDMTNFTYPSNYFDIVHCANALDHCPEPDKALREMERICMPGGYIFLRHWKNVGQYENYRGFHAWNIDKIFDDVRIWNQEDSFLLSDFFHSFTVEEQITPGNTPEAEIVIKIHKV